MARKKGPVWKHYNIKDNNNKEKHPYVECKYCPKKFERGIPERMQDHLDQKCPKAPDNAKSQFGQQNTTSRIDHMSERESQSLSSLTLSDSLTLNKETAITQTNNSSQSGSLYNIYYTDSNYEFGKEFEYYKEAANKGHIDSISWLGICCMFGIEIPRNNDKARELNDLYDKVKKVTSFEYL
jgi:hypothetical protein